jgi:tetratricopeptide (TPR) repeat protein
LGVALGQAEANRVLGEVHLRRGQLGQAVSVFDRSIRSFRAQQAPAPLGRALLGDAEANRRRANPRRAEDLFTEARQLAAASEQVGQESSAMLGLGQIARVRGQTQVAAPLLDEAAKRFERQGRLAQAAAAVLEQARLALTRGDLDEAGRLASRGAMLAREAGTQAGETGPEALAATVQSALSLTLGQVERARELAAQALSRADREGDAQAQIEAQLEVAEVDLAAEDLNTAVNDFNRVASRAAESESPLAEGLARVGLGRILLRRGLWEEASAAHLEQIARFKTADDPAAQALAQLGVGEAQRNLGATDEARRAFVEAQRLYAEVESPLGQAEAYQGEAQTAMTAAPPKFEVANKRYARALELVERVGTGLQDAAQRASFFDRAASLYSEAIYAAVRQEDSARTVEVARGYAGRAGKAGRAAAGQRLREYEQLIPTKGNELTKEEVERNKGYIRALGEARKILG